MRLVREDANWANVRVFVNEIVMPGWSLSRHEPNRAHRVQDLVPSNFAGSSAVERFEGDRQYAERGSVDFDDSRLLLNLLLDRLLWP